jgi:hypothetical protein
MRGWWRAASALRYVALASHWLGGWVCSRPLKLIVKRHFFRFLLEFTTMRIRYFLGIALLTGHLGCSSGGGPAEVFL